MCEVVMQFSGGGDAFIMPSTYHPEFGLSIENTKIVYSQDNCELPFTAKMQLLWREQLSRY